MTTNGAVPETVTVWADERWRLLADAAEWARAASRLHAADQQAWTRHQLEGARRAAELVRQLEGVVTAFGDHAGLSGAELGRASGITANGARKRATAPDNRSELGRIMATEEP